jgi:hypothetical protein
MGLRIASLGVALAASILLSGAAAAAPPDVPATLSYQGLLLDAAGQPRSGPVGLTVRIYDALIGGALVYKQGFASVPLADGVFTVQLGPTGDASDSPANPLTTSLATALAGDAGPSAPARFLEVTVGSEFALSRTQIVSSAYALRATSAESADSAETATTAQNATQVGGLPSAVVSELWEHFNADGGGPPNTDASEGLVDLDGDGAANFVDADNDDDGIPDVSEISGGSDINLVTPSITNLVPPQLFAISTAQVTVNGLSFQPGLTVSVGSENPAPVDIAPTSFKVTVGPQPAGAKTVTVTLPNGQFAVAAGALTFLSSIAHAVTMVDSYGSLDVLPGGGRVLLGGVQQYGVGGAAESVFALASNGAAGQIGMAFDGSDRVAGLRCRTLGGSTCSVELLADADADGDLEDETGLSIETIGGTATLLAADLEYDAAGGAVAAYLKRTTPTEAFVAHDRNADGDFADANEKVLVQTSVGGTGAIHAALAVDSANRVAYAFYSATLGSTRVAWDRNGDGDYADTVGGNPELFSLPAPVGSLPICLGAAFDSSDRLAIMFAALAGDQTLLLRDLNADGDLSDAGESTSLGIDESDGCDVVQEPGQPLAVLYRGAGGLTLGLDKTGDGDFDDPGETTSYPAGTGATDARVALDGGSIAVVAFPSLLNAVTTTP